MMQAVDQPSRACTKKEYKQMLAEPSLSTTSRLGGVVLLHVGMRVRFTCNVLPPFVTQDSTGVVHRMLLQRSEPMASWQGSTADGLIKLQALPQAVLVQLDGCDEEFLPPEPCREHLGNPSRTCPACRFFPGIIAIKPQKAKWNFRAQDQTSIAVTRFQIPLCHEKSCPLYSMQGMTATPGLVAHFCMPRNASSDLQYLIVYVLLSRVRALTELKTVGLSQKIFDIIQRGPPEELVGTFDKMFESKIETTCQKAREARQRLGWPDS